MFHDGTSIPEQGSLLGLKCTSMDIMKHNLYEPNLWDVADNTVLSLVYMSHSVIIFKKWIQSLIWMQQTFTFAGLFNELY